MFKVAVFLLLWSQDIAHDTVMGYNFLQARMAFPEAASGK